MGSFFGGLLAEKGLDVVLVDVWAEHVETINTRGLRIVGVGGDRVVKVNIHKVHVNTLLLSLCPQVRATSKPESESAVDIVFVQCKAAHTKQAIMGARNMFKQVERVIMGF